MRADSSFHRRSNSQGLMDPRKIVVHVKERNHRHVVVDRFGERVRQPGKPAHVHSHVEILAIQLSFVRIWLGPLLFLQRFS